MKRRALAFGLGLILLTSLALAQPGVVTNDATMARVRLANLVFGSGATDLYLDGNIILLGDSQRELSRVPVGIFTGFSYVEPGSHSVAVVPTGASRDAAMIDLEVTLEAGHRYSVLVMGQKRDASFTPLVIDETAALAQARTSPEQNVLIYVNNLAGADTTDFLMDGVGPSAVPYGGFMAAPIVAGQVDTLVVNVNGDPVREDGFPPHELPGVDFVQSFIGQVEGAREVDVSSHMSDLDAVALLQQIGDFAVVWSYQVPLSFDTFLALLETAGLDEVLSAGPHLVFAPTDAAFEALPQERLDALAADPAAAAAFLRYHIVEGYYPTGALSGATFGGADITLANLEGAELVLWNTFVNGVNVAGEGTPHIVVANGTRISPIVKVLLPPGGGTP